MTKADIAARAAKLNERRSERSTHSETAAPTPSSHAKAAPRAKPVRVTTDLAPQDYRQLIAYCTELAETFGHAKVPHAEVIRALVGHLEHDPSLRHTIANAVHERISK